MLPLKLDEKGEPLPIKSGNIKKIPPLEDVLLFFAYAINPRTERRFKIQLLCQAGFRCRIHEVCAMNLKDLIQGTNFREWYVLIQKKKRNVIERKCLPESIAALLRNWIFDNKEWILRHEGYIFPHTNNKRQYSPPSSIQNWFIKKRKWFIKTFPGRSFAWTIGSKVVYHRVDNFVIPKKNSESRYIWTTHLMKRLSGTLIYQMTKDPVFTKAMLCHDDIRVTQEYYIDQATLLENKEEKIMNKIFDIHFYDAITKENEKAVGVWDELKTKPKTP